MPWGISFIPHILFLISGPAVWFSLCSKRSTTLPSTVTPVSDLWKIRKYWIGFSFFVFWGISLWHFNQELFQSCTPDPWCRSSASGAKTGFQDWHLTFPTLQIQLCGAEVLPKEEWCRTMMRLSSLMFCWKRVTLYRADHGKTHSQGHCLKQQRSHWYTVGGSLYPSETRWDRLNNWQKSQKFYREILLNSQRVMLCSDSACMNENKKMEKYVQYK